MNRLMILILFAAQLAAAGCATWGRTRPEVTRRYATYTDSADNSANVKVSLFALPVPSATTPETAITSLGAEAQAELVKVMADRTKDAGPEGLVRALAMPIRSASAAPSFRDLTRISRRLVFSVDNRSRGPANRISEARISVQPMNGTRFVSWNRIENIYETVDMGKLSLSQERSTSAALALTLPVLSAAPSINASSGSTLLEEVQLRPRRAVLTGTLRPSEAILLQQGGFGIDLIGNVTADIDFVVPNGGHQTVFIPSLPDTCARPSFDRQTIRYPARDTLIAKHAGNDTAGPAPVRVTVQLEYALRDVPGGHATTGEGDDAVVFRRGQTAVDTALVIPGEALRFSVFELRARDSTVYIQGATPSGTANGIAPLQFGTFEQATEMLRWIRRCEIPGVRFPLLLGGQRLMRAGEENSVYVWRTPINYGGEGGDTPSRR